MQPLRMDLRFGKIVQWVFLALLSLIFLMGSHSAQAAGTVSTCNEASLTTALNGGGTVLFACDGTITLNTTSTDGFTINKTTTIDANGHNVTISGNNTHRLFTVNGSITFTLQGITLTNGLSQSNAGGTIIQGILGTINISNTVFANSTFTSNGNPASGSLIDYAHGSGMNIYNSRFVNNANTNGIGIIAVFNTDLTVKNSVFSNNSAGGQASGVIYTYESPTSITGSQFISNTGTKGGVIYNDGGPITITGSQFTNNTSSSIGGAILNASNALTVTNSSFTNNSGNQGGAIFLSDGTTTANMFNDTFTNNKATGSSSYGGAFLVNAPNASTVISNSTLTGNTAAELGGGLALYNGNVTIVNSAVLSNTASTGGAFFVTSGNITVANSTVAYNASTDSLSPGGVLQTNGTNTVNFINSTISNNTAVGGVGSVLLISSGNTTTFTNTITANNGANQVPCTYRGTTIVDGGNNIQNNSSNNCVGTAIDPKLGPLQNNGGPTLSEALLAGSPAINSGNNTVCQTTPINKIDQRGASRLQGSACDIGAYEVGSLTGYGVYSYAGSGQNTPGTTPFTNPLTARVVGNNGAPVANVTVTFALPSSGASATFAGGSTVYSDQTNANGIVTTPLLTANAITGTYTVVATVAGGTNSASFSLTNLTAPITYKVIAVSGSGQTTLTSTDFSNPLVAQVVDSNNTVISSRTVTFTLLSSGPSATFAGGSLTYVGETDASGEITTPMLTANSTVGSYTAVATIGGGTAAASFNLTNSLAGCNSLVVTQATDDGTASSCGTFSYALSQLVGTASTPVTLTFAIDSGNTIIFSGPLSQTVKRYVYIDGINSINSNNIILNGNGVASAGLQLEGGDTLKSLTVEHFGGTQIRTLGSGNRLIQVQAIK